MNKVTAPQRKTLGHQVNLKVVWKTNTETLSNSPEAALLHGQEVDNKGEP